MVDAGNGELRIDADPVLGAASEIRLIADELRDGLQQLTSAVDAVVEGSWRGAAAEVFGRGWDEFRRPAARVVEDADEIAHRVAAAVKIYGAQDESSALDVRSSWHRG